MRNFIAAIFACLGMTVAPALVEAHPVMLSLSVKNCSSNANQAASVSLNMAPQMGLSAVRYSFRNVATGQVHNFDRPMSYTGPNDFTVPGGNYTMRISLIDDPAIGVAVPGSVQLVYDTPIPVPLLTGGVCRMPGGPVRAR